MPLGASWGPRGPSGGRRRCLSSLLDRLGPCGALWEATWSAPGALLGPISEPSWPVLGAS
eukprot:1284511-Pyramimonas_sp.AAC.1